MMNDDTKKGKANTVT